MSHEEPLVGLPKNFLKSCLLLLLAEGSAHGYEINDRLCAFGLHHDDPGGLYRALRSLDNEGLVVSHWEAGRSGPARRRYAISADGEVCLKECAATMAETRAFIDRFLERYEQVSQPRVHSSRR